MRKTMLSGIKPTGQLTLGNYIGALKPFVASQDDFDLKVFIANLHCVTMPIEPEELRTNLRDALAFYLASGLDPKRCSIFLQTDVHEIAQLGFIMACLTPMGELNRMTQFKDKKDTGISLSGGFYTYPALMSADILIHQAHYVPVGEDQKQHVELARNTAERFNNRFGETFVVPEPVIQKVGSKIYSLQDPTKKMSKSDKEGEKGVIYLRDDLKQARKKIMSAVTDSVGIVQYDPENQPGVANLLTIYASLKEITIEEVCAEFEDAQYGTFKKAVADCVCEELEMLQSKYDDFVGSEIIDEILKEGSDAVRPAAQETLAEVEKKMGMIW
ncbi:MAG: tryptophan--tRNA ligase [Erysipelothrix sp.]